MSRVFEALQQSKVELIAGIQTDERERLPGAAGGTHHLENVPAFTLPAAGKTRLCASAREANLGAEKLRILATRLRALQQHLSFKKVLITSSMRDEGKSLLTANLAITLAKQSQRVLLVDADLRHPMLARMLGANGTRGLCDWNEAEPIHKYLHRAASLPLWLLPAGTIPHEPLTILQQSRIPRMFDQFADWFDWVIIDSPPVTSFADSSVLAAMADRVVLVVRQGKTPKKLLEKCLESLEPAKILGVILNEATTIENTYYKRYYHRDTAPTKK